MKYDRRAKKTCETISSSKSVEYSQADLESVYRLHRKYVRSLIAESDILPETAPASVIHDTWSVFESVFIMK